MNAGGERTHPIKSKHCDFNPRWEFSAPNSGWIFSYYSQNEMMLRPSGSAPRQMQWMNCNGWLENVVCIFWESRIEQWLGRTTRQHHGFSSQWDKKLWGTLHSNWESVKTRTKWIALLTIKLKKNPTCIIKQEKKLTELPGSYFFYNVFLENNCYTCLSFKGQKSQCTRTITTQK
jgi:hypothetical protein